MYLHDDCHGGYHPLSFYFLQTVIDIEYTATNLKKVKTRTAKIIRSLNWHCDTDGMTVNIYIF